MAKILGLDLGTNSIGWAVIDRKNEKILGLGVRIFKEGVVDMGKGEKEKSKNAARNELRSSRRQYFRRRLRKDRLLRLLKENEMCPSQTSLFDEWIKKKPYQLRSQAVKQQISLLDLGRIFYHLSQRRGFQSNSRSATANEDSTIFDGGKGKIGIKETRSKLAESTLGEYLYEILPKENLPFISEMPRVRSRYTTRQMYAAEFEKIWNKQTEFHSELIDNLKTEIGGRKKDGYDKDGVLFYQRPLRSQKHKVGKCSLEPTKTKCPISHPSFEVFRACQFINNIECNGERLSEPEREKVLKLLMSKEKSIKFMAIRKRLKLADSVLKFNYSDKDLIPGCPTISALSGKKCFGDTWFKFSEKDQEDTWHVFYSFDDKEKLKQFLQAKFNFDKEKAESACKIYFKQGYANLSRKAIENILPFLKMGFQYDIATVLGGIKNAFGNEQWGNLSIDEKQFLIDNIPEIVRGEIKGGFSKDLKGILIERYNFFEKQLRKLYHHSQKEEQKLLAKLPVGSEADSIIGKIRNPIVIQALFELRKLVNALIDEYGTFDQINIELARDLKISKDRRQKIRIENQKRESYHKGIAEKLMKLNQRVNHDNILKYKLWEECGEICPYTGNKINLTQLFNGEVQIEHILPYSRTLDDSFLNKALCFTSENANKGNKTPFEYYDALGTWEAVKDRALKIFSKNYRKYKRFTAKKLPEDFISRQLNDTRYISKEAAEYLKQICKNVQVAPGQMTARLRHFWGLNSIVGEPEDKKSRSDHRHHAVDALVMACHTRGHLKEISTWNRYDRSYQLRDFSDPWDGFRLHAIQAVNDILVSHKKNNRVLTKRNFKIKIGNQTKSNQGKAARGNLHKETVFGKRKDPKTGEEFYHVRKHIVDLTDSTRIRKIADPRILQIVLEHLRANGVNTSENFKVPPGLFVEKIEPSGEIRSKIFLENKRGESVPIFKVRIREKMSNAVQLKEDENKWVNPKNNHHVIIYKTQAEKLEQQVVKFWEAVERRRQNQPVFQMPEDGKEIIEIFSENDMFLIGLNEDEIDSIEKIRKSRLSDCLYRVQSISSKDYFFRHHLASTLEHKEEMIRIKSLKKWKELNPIKVRIFQNGNLKF